MQYHISHVPDSIGERWWRMMMDETINELPYDITLPHRTLVSLTTSLFELTIYRSWTNFSWIATESGGLHQWPVPAVYTKNSACPFTVSLLRCTPFEDVFFILLFKYLSWRSGRDNLIIILILGYALSFYLLLKYNIPFSWHWFGATCWLLAGWLVGFLLSFFQLSFLFAPMPYLFVSWMSCEIADQNCCLMWFHPPVSTPFKFFSPKYWIPAPLMLAYAIIHSVRLKKNREEKKTIPDSVSSFFLNLRVTWWKKMVFAPTGAVFGIVGWLELFCWF